MYSYLFIYLCFAQLCSDQLVVIFEIFYTRVANREVGGQPQHS